MPELGASNRRRRSLRPGVLYPDMRPPLALPPAALFRVVPLVPPGPSHLFLLGEDPPALSRDIGWEIIDRPRRKGAIEFTGITPFGLRISAVDSKSTSERSIEAELYRFEDGIVTPKGPRREPPIVRLEGPGLNTIIRTHRWVLTKIIPGREERNPDGTRNLAFMELEFLEYVEATGITTVAQSQAMAAADRAVARRDPAPTTPSGSPAPSTRTYTVKRGDTLGAIATRELGSYKRWREIADLNGIRDPRRLQIGQVLRLP